MPPPIHATAPQSGGQGRRGLKSGSLSNDPPAVRGAPRTGAAVSVASVPTHPGHDDDDDDAESSDSALSGAARGEEEKFQIMKALSADVERTTGRLEQRLRNGTYDNTRVFAVVLKTTRATFHSLMDTCSDPASPFVDFTWLEGFGRRTATDTGSLASVFARANLILALDEVESNKDSVALSVLKFLDDAFPQLLTVPHNGSRHTKLALAIRTQYLIEQLADMAAQGRAVNVAATIASIFCGQTAGHDYPLLLKEGPFRSLTERDLDLEEDPSTMLDISDRAQELYELASQDKEHHGVQAMRARYPLSKVWGDFREWCLDEYANVLDAASRGGAPAHVDEEDAFQDAREDPTESMDESQVSSMPTIRRAPHGTRKEESFLQRRGHDAKAQFRAMGPPSDAPDDAPTSSRRLLVSESGASSPAKHSHARKRPHHEVTAGDDGDDDDDDDDDDNDSDDGDDDDDDDDPFQTDDRSNVADRRRAQLKATHPVPARPRVPLRSSPQADYGYVESKKREIVARHRALNTLTSSSAPLPPSRVPSSRISAAIDAERQRHGWSENDKNLLIKLIHDTRAKWSTIEKEHNNEFEWPRNQQAYRDKARNMKVDLLIGDFVLPGGFDLVLLGKKEKEKLLSLGKNPHRKESDVDRNGRAINTDV